MAWTAGVWSTLYDGTRTATEPLIQAAEERVSQLSVKPSRGQPIPSSKQAENLVTTQPLAPSQRKWNKTMHRVSGGEGVHRIILGTFLSLLLAHPAVAQFQVENPAHGSTQSGIGLISGWKCTGTNLTVKIDGVFTLALPYGSQRGDTQAVCGDANNGFGLLVNWNLLTTGSHTIRFYDNGMEFASATFTVTTLGAQFLTGRRKTVDVPNFPNAGQTTRLEWQESSQNFAITGLSGTANAISSPSCPGVMYEANRTAVVSRVIDGDTIELEGGEQVRYVGIDTPESGQPGFTAATERNTELVNGKTVTLDVCEDEPLDPYGRTLAYVIVGTTVVNEVLLVEGLADPLHIPPCGNATATCYAQLPPDPEEECDPSYPTVCIPPPPPDLDCGDIPYRNFPVVGADPHRFDGDHDGIGCEE